MIPFRPNAPHQTVRNTSPNHHVTVLPKGALPTNQEIQNGSRHHPKNTKKDKNHFPNLPRKRAVKQQMMIEMTEFVEGPI
jgi:hypothetical protein